MKRRYKKKRKRYLEVARQRIRELFQQADAVYDTDPQLADRYVELARKIAMKYRLGIPRQLQKKFCKHCYAYLRPGDNCRVRVSGGKVVYHCRKCRKYMRFPVH